MVTNERRHGWYRGRWAFSGDFSVELELPHLKRQKPKKWVTIVFRICGFIHVWNSSDLFCWIDFAVLQYRGITPDHALMWRFIPMKCTITRQGKRNHLPGPTARAFDHTHGVLSIESGNIYYYNLSDYLEKNNESCCVSHSCVITFWRKWRCYIHTIVIFGTLLRDWVIIAKKRCDEGRIKQWTTASELPHLAWVHPHPRQQSSAYCKTWGGRLWPSLSTTARTWHTSELAAG